jgi:hypothetical protein
VLARRRLPYAVAFPAFYVGVATIRSGDARSSAWIFVAVAIGMAFALARIPESVDTNEARRRVVTATGLSIAIASCALVARVPWIAAMRDLATGAAALGAAFAIGSIEGEVGLAPRASEALSPPGLGPRAVSHIGAALIAVCSVAAAVLDVSTTATSASSSSLLLALELLALGSIALIVGAMRRLELEVPPRAVVCAAASGAGLVLAATLAVTDTLPSDTSLALGAAIAAVVVVRLARGADPTKLARRGRRAITLATFGAPLAILAVTFALGHTNGALLAVVVLFGCALVVGTIAAKLEEPFLPVKGVLLRALADGRDAAREREAREAMARAMVLLREASAVGMGPTAAPSPELWLLHPTRVVTIDAAGYASERAGSLPDGILDVALGEPHGTLRTSVLRALEVRRADLRPLLAWLEHRDALFATVISEGSDPDGLLVVPSGVRTEELTLEEARAAQLLANAFVAVAQAESAKVRHLERERELRENVDRLDDELARLRHTIEVDASRHVLAAARLARPATVGIYSAVARMAYDALERRLAQDAPTVVVARAGIDPIPYVARAHLAGSRKNAALVVVDGTASREHDLARWSDERSSPLALADRGLLFLVDGAALPREIQALIGRAVAERRAPWERAAPLDVLLALSCAAGDAVLTLATELASRFEASEAITLPGLHERPEDLRSIVADRLAREGLRVAGHPIGIDSAAFARLIEHPFEAEDAELAAIVTKLVARALADRDDVVRAHHVDALGLSNDARDRESDADRKGSEFEKRRPALR